MLKLIYRDYSEFSKYSAVISDYLLAKGENDRDTEYRVRLAVCELAGNIIKHSKSTAKVDIKIDGGYIDINITGSRSFNFNICGLPPAESEYGRGIFIVKNISDKLQYLNGGRDVSVRIKRNLST